MVVSIAAYYGLTLETYDATSAHQTSRFPDGHPEIYIVPTSGCPTTMPNGEPASIRLRCALQGLRQASALWADFYDATLQSASMTPTVSDSCIYRYSGSSLRADGTPAMLLCVKVADDLLMATEPGEPRDTLIEHLCSTHGVKAIELATAFAGINIRTEPDGGYSLHQQPYVREVLERFQFDNASPRSTPLPLGVTYKKWEGASVGHRYGEKWGALAWLACSTYSVLSSPVMILGQFLQNPGPEHMVALDHILRWLVTHGNLALTYGCNDYHHGDTGDTTGPVTAVRSESLRLVAYADAEFATLDSHTRRSAGGWGAKLGGALIDWACRFHAVIAQSSAEGEYYTLSDCVNAILHLRQLLAELEQDVSAPTIDNRSVIAWAQTRKIHRAAKDIQIRYHAVKQYVVPNGNIAELRSVPTAVNLVQRQYNVSTT